MTVVGFSVAEDAMKMSFMSITDLCVVPAIWRRPAPVPIKRRLQGIQHPGPMTEDSRTEDHCVGCWLCLESKWLRMSAHLMQTGSQSSNTWPNRRVRKTYKFVYVL